MLKAQLWSSETSCVLQHQPHNKHENIFKYTKIENWAKGSIYRVNNTMLYEDVNCKTMFFVILLVYFRLKFR